MSDLLGVVALGALGLEDLRALGNVAVVTHSNLHTRLTPSARDLRTQRLTARLGSTAVAALAQSGDAVHTQLENQRKGGCLKVGGAHVRLLDRHAACLVS